MTAPVPEHRHRRAEALGLLGIGFLLVLVAAFCDPVGASPDTGILDLGADGTRWLLGTLGLLLAAGGIWSFIRIRR